MMDHLQVAEYGRTNTPTASRTVTDTRSPDPTERQDFMVRTSPSLNQDEAQAPSAASPASD